MASSQRAKDKSHWGSELDRCRDELEGEGWAPGFHPGREDFVFPNRRGAHEDKCKQEALELQEMSRV